MTHTTTKSLLAIASAALFSGSVMAEGIADSRNESWEGYVNLDMQIEMIHEQYGSTAAGMQYPQGYQYHPDRQYQMAPEKRTYKSSSPNYDLNKPEDRVVHDYYELY